MLANGFSLEESLETAEVDPDSSLLIHFSKLKLLPGGMSIGKELSNLENFGRDSISPHFNSTETSWISSTAVLDQSLFLATIFLMRAITKGN